MSHDAELARRAQEAGMTDEPSYHFGVRGYAWAKDASCAKRKPDGTLVHDWGRWFTDDIGNSLNAKLPGTALAAIEVCAECPVRSQCLDWAFATTKPVSLGQAVFYVSHTTACNDAYYDEDAELADRAKARACRGCIPDNQRRRLDEFLADQNHTGILGGVPGFVRERYRNDPDRIARCEEWLAERRQGTSAIERAWAAKKGVA